MKKYPTIFLPRPRQFWAVVGRLSGR